MMKPIALLMLMAVALTGCNAMTATADKIMNKQSSFSAQPNTIYPTQDGTKDGAPADFAKADVSIQDTTHQDATDQDVSQDIIY